MKFPTKAEFAAWLEANPDRGNISAAHSCPLAECLKDNGAVVPAVTKTYWRNGFGGESRPLPRWASDFVRRFDITGERVVR